MFSADKKKETLALVKPEQPLKTKHQVATADSKKLPAQWVKVGTNCISHIAGFLGNDNKAAANLTQSCRFLYHGTNGALAVQKIKKLVHHVVVEPNENKVTAMLTVDPTLINVVIKEVIDPSGRILIDNTISQLAYGAGDPEMCLAIKRFFVQVYGSEKAGIEEMEKQRKQKFAEDKKADEKQDKQAKDLIQGLLNTVIAAITAEQFNLGRDANNKLILSPATLAAIETFRTEFDKSQPKRIEKGMHFRSNTLLETYNAYVEAAAQWDYSYNKCALFEDGVLSSVLFYAPANDAQRFSQGLYYLQDQKPSEKFTRSLALRIGKNNFYQVVREASLDFSLSGSSVDIYAGRQGDGRGRARGGVGMARVAFTNLMSNKNILLAELMRPIAHRPKSQCVIC